MSISKLLLDADFEYFVWVDVSFVFQSDSVVSRTVRLEPEDSLSCPYCHRVHLFRDRDIWHDRLHRRHFVGRHLRNDRILHRNSELGSNFYRPVAVKINDAVLNVNRC